MYIKLISVFCGILVGTSAFADLGGRTVPLFSPQRLQLGIEGQTFRTNSNFLSNGLKENLPSDYRFLTYDFAISSMYDLSEEWAVSSDLGISYAESYSNSDLRVSRKIRDLTLGIYRLYDTTYFGRFILDGHYLYNFVDNKTSNDEVSVGDGISWLQLGFWWEPRKTRNKNSKDSDYVEKFGAVSPFQGILRTYLGFRTRPGFSDVLVFRVHPHLIYKKFMIGGELNGMLSVVKEDDDAKVSKEVYNSQFNASSFRYNSWNPYILEGAAWIGYRVRPYTQIRLGGSQVLGMENTAAGTGFFFDIQTSMAVTPSGMFFSDYFSKTKKLNPRRNNIEIKNLGPAPKVEEKIVPSDLQDL